MITYAHNQNEKIQLGTKASMWLGLSNRLNDYEQGSKRYNEISEALTNEAMSGMERFGWEAWGQAVTALAEKFPEHDFFSHAKQVVWFAKNA